MQSINILIFDKRFLIRKGLSVVLKNLDKHMNISDVEDILHFQQTIQNSPPDYLFLQSKKLQKISTKKNYSILNHTKIILLSSKLNFNEPTISNFIIAERICISDGKKDLISNIKKFFLNELAEIESSDEIDEISKREKEIVKYVALGYTNQQIANKLFISPHTASTHRKNISKKLGIKTVSGLTIYAILNNIITINKQS